jgi:hypothetical protein
VSSRFAGHIDHASGVWGRLQRTVPSMIRLGTASWMNVPVDGMFSASSGLIGDEGQVPQRMKHFLKPEYMDKPWTLCQS